MGFHHIKGRVSEMVYHLVHLRQGRKEVEEETKKKKKKDEEEDMYHKSVME